MKHFGGPILSFCYSILNEEGSIGGQIAVRHENSRFSSSFFDIYSIFLLHCNAPAIVLLPSAELISNSQIWEIKGIVFASQRDRLSLQQSTTELLNPAVMLCDLFSPWGSLLKVTAQLISRAGTKQRKAVCIFVKFEMCLLDNNLCTWM